ncbi:MAG: hypothetical protein ACTSUE_22020 [Promethearchaeota archaeon]
MSDANQIREPVVEKGEEGSKIPEFNFRICTIDYMKGFSMILIFALHMGWLWLREEAVAFTRLLFLVFDFFGPSMFVTLSVVGSIIGFYKRKRKGIKYLLTTHQILKASFLLIIGELLNLMNIDMGGWHILSWNVISFVGILTLLIPFILNLDWKVRLTILILIVFSYYPFYNWCLGGVSQAGVDVFSLTPELFDDPRVLVFYLLFNPENMTPAYSWFIVPFMTSLVFERFIKANVDKDRRKMIQHLRVIGWGGVVTLSLGIIFGIQLVDPVNFNPNIMDQLTNTVCWYSWPFPSGIPVIWIRHTPQYLFYNFGLLSIMFLFYSYREVVYAKKFWWQEKMCIFGVLSLTGFLLSSIGVLIPIKMTFVAFWLFFFPYIVVIIYVFWYWSAKHKAFMSFEWIMIAYATAVKRAMRKAIEKKKKKRTT